MGYDGDTVPLVDNTSSTSNWSWFTESWIAKESEVMGRTLSDNRTEFLLMALSSGAAVAGYFLNSDWKSKAFFAGISLTLDAAMLVRYINGSKTHRQPSLEESPEKV